MTEAAATARSNGWIDLARESAFELGAAQVRPTACEVDAHGEAIWLQPRVMQVLVALARAQGDIVSRDALVESCWGGLAVGEDAINRCVQRLRRLSESEAPGAFRIETLPRVGYRLVRATASAGGARVRPRLRLMAAAVLLLAATVAGVLVWGRLLDQRRPAPWSDEDIRNTLVMAPVPVTGDPALAAYADQFTQGLASRFMPGLGDMRLRPMAGPGAQLPTRFAIGLEFRRSGAGVVTRVTLREKATGAVVHVGEVADGLGPAPSFSAIFHASGLVKPPAWRREAELAEAKPPDLRDARDLFILEEPLPRDRDGEAKAIALLDAALRLAPGEYQVKRALAARLDDRVAGGWSSDPHAESERARAIAADLLRDNPTDYWGLMVPTDTFMVEGRWQDCIVAADRVLAVKPDDAFALEDKAQAELALGDFGQADKILAELAPFQAPNDQFPYPQYAGKVRFHQRRLSEAEALFRRALQVTPAADVILPAYAGLRLYLAAAEVEDGHLAEARDDLRAFQAAVPRVLGPSEFLKWNDNNRFPLTDWPRLRADLAKIGWKDVA